MKKYLILGMMMLLMMLTVAGCKKKGETRIDDLTLVTPSGDEIYLYMPREDVEELLGEGEKSGYSTYYYNDNEILINYKDGVVGNIYVQDLGYQTKSGIIVGEPFTLTGYRETDNNDYMKAYIKKDGGLVEFNPDKDKTLDNSAFMLAFMEDESVSILMITDQGWSMEDDYDE